MKQPATGFQAFRVSGVVLGALCMWSPFIPTATVQGERGFSLEMKKLEFRGIQYSTEAAGLIREPSGELMSVSDIKLSSILGKLRYLTQKTTREYSSVDGVSH